MARTLILKFGGASLRDLSHFENVASIILQESKNYDRVCVVVSAMEGMTDYLVSLADSVHMDPPKREKDMLLSVGERVSMSLLAMKLSEKGIDAVSLTGSQAGIITSNEHNEAKILEIRPKRLLSLYEDKKVPIIAGFQGMSLDKEVTTLGRGGSDTTAVALGIALDAERIVFYKDVEGVYSKDPKKYSDAKIEESLSYKRALAVIGTGMSAVLHPRCVRLAEKNGMILNVRSFDQKLKDKVGSVVFCVEGQKRDSGKIYEEALSSIKG
ncbi:MAG: Aspartokinase [Chlamydiia bacterium]|nr:Aspartokinase [Chlamydiia bacterium]